MSRLGRSQFPPWMNKGPDAARLSVTSNHQVGCGPLGGLGWVIGISCDTKKKIAE